MVVGDNPTDTHNDTTATNKDNKNPNTKEKNKTQQKKKNKFTKIFTYHCHHQVCQVGFRMIIMVQIIFTRKESDIEFGVFKNDNLI